MERGRTSHLFPWGQRDILTTRPKGLTVAGGQRPPGRGLRFGKVLPRARPPRRTFGLHRAVTGWLERDR